MKNNQSTPNRSKRVHVGLPPEVHAIVKDIAEHNHRSIVLQIACWAENDTSRNSPKE